MISEHPELALKQLGKYFALKEGSVGEPSLYLGAKITKVTLPNGVSAWGWSSSKYVQEVIRNLGFELELRGHKLRRNVSSPFSSNCRPELDISPEYNDDDGKLYL